MRLLTIFLFLLTVIGCAACTSVPPPRESLPTALYTENPPPAGVILNAQPVYIDKAFSEGQRQSIREAVAEWNYVMNGYMRYDVVNEQYDMEPSVAEDILNTGQGLIVLQARSEDVDEEGVLAWVPVMEDLGNGVGITAPLIHVVSDRIGTRNLKMILLHEMVHVQYLGHIQIRGTLMYPNYEYQPPCFDKTTAMALSSIRRNLDWRHMNWCDLPR